MRPGMSDHSLDLKLRIVYVDRPPMAVAIISIIAVLHSLAFVVAIGRIR